MTIRRDTHGQLTVIVFNLYHFPELPFDQVTGKHWLPDQVSDPVSDILFLV